MGKVIAVPGRGNIEFPDSMSNADIEAALVQLSKPPERLSEDQATSLSNAMAGAGAPELPREQAPTTAEIDWGKVQKHKQQAPWEAAVELAKGVYDPSRKSGQRWFQGNETTRDLGRLATEAVPATIGALSTDNALKRQETYVRQIPGAKAVTDRWGEPMVEIDGQRYYVTGPALTGARIGLGVGGGVIAGAALPATVPGLVIGGGLITGGQSLLEDFVSGATRGKPEDIDFGKAGLATVLGGLTGLLGVKAPVLIGRLNDLLKRGVPLTDDTLRAAGLTTEQIDSMTPEIRQQVTNAYRRTFGDPRAVGSTYRTELSKDAGVNLTRGEITGDAAQIAREQTLSQPKDVPGRAKASEIIQSNRDTQDAALNAAQTRLRTNISPNIGPSTPTEAANVLQGVRDARFNLAGENVDLLYGAARNPDAVVAAGGREAVPAAHTTQFGAVTRQALEGNDIGRIVLSEEAGNLTPNAKSALALVDRFSKRATGPRAAKEGGLLQFSIDQPPIQQYPDITWQEAEGVRKALVAYQKKAIAAQRAGGTGEDVAALEQIIQSFDDHFGKLNPLYAPARAAHAEKMETFVPGGSPAQDRATKGVLTALDGPEGGAAVTNKIMAAKKDEAIGMIDHLNNKVFKDSPEAQGVIKEQFMRRLFVDDHGKQLTPRQMATAIEKAFGEKEGPLYQRLFSGLELSELRRRYELIKAIAEGRDKINPPNSGLINQAMDQVKNARDLGMAIGAVPGLLMKDPYVTAGGVGVGRVIGGAVDAALPPVQAGRAIAPPPGYGTQMPVPPKTGAAVGGATSQIPSLLDDFWARQYGGIPVPQ